MKGTHMANVHETSAGEQENTTRVSNAKSKSMDALRDKVEETAAEIQARVSETGHQVREHARELRTQAKDIGAEAIEAASEYYRQGYEKVQVLEQTLEAQIREKPIQSLLIAGGIGLLLGLLWKRR
jgi:ElaB/YqjD/DUF883 family membrane-anchored ribosome-binding protein